MSSLELSAFYFYTLPCSRKIAFCSSCIALPEFCSDWEDIWLTKSNKQRTTLVGVENKLMKYVLQNLCWNVRRNILFPSRDKLQPHPNKQKFSGARICGKIHRFTTTKCSLFNKSDITLITFSVSRIFAALWQVYRLVLSYRISYHNFWWYVSGSFSTQVWNVKKLSDKTNNILIKSEERKWI